MQQKNNQIVENKYRSKIRRHLNKIESRIKQNPKSKTNLQTNGKGRIHKKLGNHQHYQRHDHQIFRKRPISPQKRPQKL